MFCSQCAAQLSPDDVYCPKCAKPVASFAFDRDNVSQVEPLETPTVVRTRESVEKPDRSKVMLITAIAVATIGVIAIVGAILFANRSSNREVAVQNVNVYVTPMPTETPIRTPTVDPFVANVANQAAANVERAIANAVQEAANSVSNSSANRPPAFDKKGKPLRAICKDGTPSYYQGSRSLTCLTKGGVRVWYF
jgi:hypothetical protein